MKMKANQTTIAEPNRHEGQYPMDVQIMLVKYDAGLPLKDHELMCVQYVRNGFGCGTCSKMHAALV